MCNLTATSSVCYSLLQLQERVTWWFYTKILCLGTNSPLQPTCQKAQKGTSWLQGITKSQWYCHALGHGYIELLPQIWQHISRYKKWKQHLTSIVNRFWVFLPPFPSWHRLSFDWEILQQLCWENTPDYKAHPFD